MKTINIHAAKTHLSRLVEEAAAAVNQCRPEERMQIVTPAVLGVSAELPRPFIESF